ncbi:MAG TPA: ABC transporter permease [Acidimicrobiales bacterium]|nr:ABC transporter permease [Acidimicrobiales bacterium]
MTTLSELASSRELLSNLMARELKGKYKRSTLGWMWSLLNPLATMAIFTVVFRLFLRINPPVGDPSGLTNFALFLLCGLLPWNLLSAGMVEGAGALVNNAAVIKKVWFPRETIVLANVAALNVTFLIELAVLSVALLTVGNMVLPWLPVVLVLVLLLSLFVLGLALALSVLNVYFRDVQYLLGIVMQLWFYATPIIYPVSLVQSADFGRWERLVLTVYNLNPMVHFVGAFRDCFYNLRFPPASAWAVMVGVTAVSLAIGAFTFRKFTPRLAEEL